jgi:hypothetical protein
MGRRKAALLSRAVDRSGCGAGVARERVLIRRRLRKRVVPGVGFKSAGAGLQNPAKVRDGLAPRSPVRKTKGAQSQLPNRARRLVSAARDVNGHE